MIEKFIRNELTLKRWRRFRKSKRAIFSIWALAILTFMSCTAEFWANSKPIFLRYHGQNYIPILKTYVGSEFGRDDLVIMDYRQLKLGHGDFAAWPIMKWDPYESNSSVENYPSGPSRENIFGTDDRGRDVAARLLYGFRYSMGYALMTWVATSILGIIFGSLMGFYGGWVDLLGQRVIEIMESLPWLLLLITIISIFGSGFWLLVILTTIFGWVSISLYIRGEFLRLRKREFVEAARALGGNKQRQIFKHILPNSLTPWLTMSPFIISGGITGLAALDFLGFGLPAPTPSWGELLDQAYKNFTIAWWLAVFPSAALFLTLVFSNLIGEGVRDALDPRK